MPRLFVVCIFTAYTVAGFFFSSRGSSWPIFMILAGQNLLVENSNLVRTWSAINSIYTSECFESLRMQKSARNVERIIRLQTFSNAYK